MYSHVSLYGPDLHDSQQHQHNTAHHYRFDGIISMLRHILLYTLAFLGLFAMIREIWTLNLNSQPRSESRFESCSCGRSVAEALAQGCRYDLLASAWLPDQCRDDELSAEFDRSGPGPNGEWTYYADKDGTRMMNASDIGAMADIPGFLYYTTLEWHMLHCKYYWLKALRVKKLGLTLEKRYDTEGHIRHCFGILMMKDMDLNAIKTVQGVSLTSE